MTNETDHHGDTVRLETFSDGVFAIAITLLVLEITVPHVAEGESLARALWDEWPSYFGFTLSFIVIGIIWMNHHELFKDIERVDHTLLVLNLLLLMGTSLLPFTTAVFADYLESDDHLRVATLVYAANGTVNAVLFNALWLYASRGRRLIDRHVSQVRIDSRTKRYVPGPLIYGSTLPLAFVSPWISIAILVISALIYLLPLAEALMPDEDAQ